MEIWATDRLMSSTPTTQLSAITMSVQFWQRLNSSADMSGQVRQCESTLSLINARVQLRFTTKINRNVHSMYGEKGINGPNNLTRNVKSIHCLD